MEKLATITKICTGQRCHTLNILAWHSSLVEQVSPSSPMHNPSVAWGGKSTKDCVYVGGLLCLSFWDLATTSKHLHWKVPGGSLFLPELAPRRSYYHQDLQRLMASTPTPTQLNQRACRYHSLISSSSSSSSSHHHGQAPLDARPGSVACCGAKLRTKRSKSI